MSTRHALLMGWLGREIFPCARRSTMLALGLALTASCAYAQRTLHVAPNGSHDSAGYFPDWAGASTSIQAAVNLATNGDVVLVTNYPSPYLLNSNIVVSSSITLRSYNAGALDATNTVLDGQGLVRCLYLSSVDALIAGFTLTNGNGLGNGGLTHGGGAYIAGGILSNCIVAGNVADTRGGGIYASGVNGLITDSLIAGNIQTNNASTVPFMAAAAFISSTARNCDAAVSLAIAPAISAITPAAAVFSCMPPAKSPIAWSAII